VLTVLPSFSFPPQLVWLILQRRRARATSEGADSPRGQRSPKDKGTVTAASVRTSSSAYNLGEADRAAVAVAAAAVGRKKADDTAERKNKGKGKR
jgi:hypothetical protein